MLKKLSVTNFMGFKDTITLDFKAHTYAFNEHLIKNKLVNKAIIYGKNGSGKTNLGLAIFDIYGTLTDGIKNRLLGIQHYINLNSDNDIVTFSYDFLFGKQEVTYTYKKKNIDDLIFEELKINNKVVLHFDISEDISLLVNKIKTHNKINLTPYIKFVTQDKSSYKLSLLKFIYQADFFSEDSEIAMLFNFVNRMLWVRSLSQGNDFIGDRKYLSTIDKTIIEKDKVEEFESFLHKNDLNYKLQATNFQNNPLIAAKFKKGLVTLDSIISSGTSFLRLYYFWSLYFNEVSFLFLDEYDAFYHYETATNILKDLENYPNMQTVVTTHNIKLMDNDLVRPDTCFILNNNKIKCLKELTDKELREAHNLSKLYVNGAFNE